MKAQSVKQVQVGRKHPIILDAESLSVRRKEAYEAVARRAYQLFENRGYENGHDIEDWLRAESELLYTVPVEIREFNDQLLVVAEVGGFSPEEIEIGAEPQRLFSSGKKKIDLEANTVYMQEPVEVFRTVELPAPVNASKGVADLDYGTLKITLPKTII